MYYCIFYAFMLRLPYYDLDLQGIVADVGMDALTNESVTNVLASYGIDSGIEGSVAFQVEVRTEQVKAARRILSQWMTPEIGTISIVGDKREIHLQAPAFQSREFAGMPPMALPKNIQVPKPAWKLAVKQYIHDVEDQKMRKTLVEWRERKYITRSRHITSATEIRFTSTWDYVSPKESYELKNISEYGVILEGKHARIAVP